MESKPDNDEIKLGLVYLALIFFIFFRDEAASILAPNFLNDYESLLSNFFLIASIVATIVYSIIFLKGRYPNDYFVPKKPEEPVEKKPWTDEDTIKVITNVSFICTGLLIIFNMETFIGFIRFMGDIIFPDVIFRPGSRGIFMIPIILMVFLPTVILKMLSIKLLRRYRDRKG